MKKLTVFTLLLVIFGGLYFYFGYQTETLRLGNSKLLFQYPLRYSTLNYSYGVEIQSRICFDDTKILEVMFVDKNSDYWPYSTSAEEYRQKNRISDASNKTENHGNLIFYNFTLDKFAGYDVGTKLVSFTNDKMVEVSIPPLKQSCGTRYVDQQTIDKMINSFNFSL